MYGPTSQFSTQACESSPNLASFNYFLADYDKPIWHAQPNLRASCLLGLMLTFLTWLIFQVYLLSKFILHTTFDPKQSGVFFLHQMASIMASLDHNYMIFVFMSFIKLVSFFFFFLFLYTTTLVVIDLYYINLNISLGFVSYSICHLVGNSSDRYEHVTCFVANGNLSFGFIVLNFDQKV